MTDPISDFLTRLRNASKAKKAETSAPHSNMKESIAAIFKADGFISDFSIGADEKGHKTHCRHAKVCEREPGDHQSHPRFDPGHGASTTATARFRGSLNGLGISILSTSRGLMNNQDCLRNKVGGELICNVW
jgi:small subunit ribosomal protein S8